MCGSGNGDVYHPGRGRSPKAPNSKDTMADDLDEDFDPDVIEEEEIDEEVDPDAIDEDIVDDPLAASDDLDTVDGDDDAAPEAAVEEPAATRGKKRADDEEDDDEEVDPDDVEADLDTILKDRIAAADEDDEDDELEEQPRVAETPDGVVPKRANEFMCPGCFLLVNRGQFGPESNLQCPVGESECPAIDILRSPAPAVAPTQATKSGRKR
jgi:hypothetical protein